MTVKFTTVPSKRLAETINASAYSFSLQDIKGWNGSNLAASDFGTDLYASFRNSLGTKLELMKIDPSTIASASITILKRGLGFDGDQSTEVSANIQDVWVKGDTIVELGSDVSQLLEETVRKSGDQTITGKKTFPSDNINNAGISSDVDTTVPTAFVTLGQLSRQAISGASNASTTVKGIVELATQAEYDARTTTGATGAKLVPTPDIIRNILTHDYAVDAGGTDTYTITLTPAVTAYANGDIYYFKANTANTGACTLNVNSVGAKSLKIGGQDPYDGYISAGGYVCCQYDGTNMNILWSSAVVPVSQKGTEIYAVDAVGSDSYAITLAPALTAYTSGMVVYFKAGTANTGAATLNINALGAKAIKKNVSNDLSTGDILAGQLVGVQYDGTNFQMISAQQPLPVYNTGQTSRFGGSGTGTQDIAHGLGVTPKLIKITAVMFRTGGSIMTSFGTAKGTSTDTCIYATNSQTAGTAGNDSSAIINGTMAGGFNYVKADVSTLDSTNITLNFSVMDGSTDCYIQWEAFA